MKADEIIDAFLDEGWKSKPMDKTIHLVKEDREQALPLALAVLERVQKGGTFCDFLFSHLTEAEFRQLVGVGVERLSEKTSDAVSAVIAYASLQFPMLLHPHLEAIFQFQPNKGAYYESWPWRGAGSDEVARLKELTRSSDPGIQKRAWRCLIEVRDHESITYAKQLFTEAFGQGVGLQAYTELAGFDTREEVPRRLHTEHAHHLTFPASYLKALNRHAWLSPDLHPTWALDGSPVSDGAFGGVCANTCGFCGDDLHRILRLNHCDKILGLGLPQLELTTCLSCLGWEQDEMLFHHNEQGTATPFSTETTLVEPEFRAKPFMAVDFCLKRAPARWQFQDWALSNGRENLNRVGGSPCWVQDSQYPQCPGCKDTMVFIAQVDSELPTSDGEEWLWGSGGIAYFFWCDRCHVSANLWQCT